MTAKEYNVERYKIEVQEAESRLRHVKVVMDEGFKKEQAKLDQAKSEMEREYSYLKKEFQYAQNQLAKEKLALQFAEIELAKGFES